ncbi:hypothetical protein U6B65_10915 [Oscillospiraceae bacterium MB08-C2-2]|nr:hypothetical protein U6B65_10915 [Oscillospiraceae bacterium MB08-C2-2]
MGKYLVRYMIFWLPGAILALTFQNDSMFSVILQWFFAFFFLFGWAVNSGMASAYYPRSTLSFLLVYTGIVALGLIAMYSASYHSQWGNTVRLIVGLLSFQPMDIAIQLFLRYSIPHEAYVLGLQVITCLIGYFVGLIYRKSKGIGRRTLRYRMPRY